jgi:hypothetical protein
MITGLPDSVESVRGVIKSVAALVIITFTSALSFLKRRTRAGILKAAILPVIPMTILFPCNM